MGFSANRMYATRRLAAALVIGACPAQDPGSAPALLEQGERSYARNDFAAAAPALRQAATLLENGHQRTRARDAWRKVARCGEQMRRWSEAATAWQRVVEIHDDVAETAESRDSSDQALALFQWARALMRLGHAAQALPRYERALAIYRRLLDGDHQGIGTCLTDLARCHMALRDPSAARRLFEQALAMYRRLFEGDHEATASTLGNLAECVAALGEHEEALPIYREALDSYLRLFGGDHPGVTASQANLAKCLCALQQPEAARPLYERALATYRRLLPEHHPQIAACLNNLAGCLEDLDQYGAARPLREEVLAIYRRHFRGDHRYVALAMNNLAVCLKEFDRAAEALPMYEEASAMYQRLYTGDHPRVAGSLNNLARCLQALERPADALPLLERALAMRQRLFRGDHLAVATSLNNLARCLAGLGRSAAARPLHERALAMQRRLLPGDHEDVAATLANLGVCLRSLGRPAEARAHYEQALAMWERLSAEDAPEVARTMGGLAASLNDLGQPEAARALLEETLGMQKRLFGGEQHPDVANTLNNIAACLASLGRLEAARRLHEQTLAMQRGLFEGDHRNIATSLNNLAHCLGELGEHALARPLHAESLAMRERLLGNDHPDVARSRANLAACLSHLGETEAARTLLEQALVEARRAGAPDVFLFATSLAHACCLAGDREQARSLLRDAAAAIERSRAAGAALRTDEMQSYFGRLKRFDTHGLALRNEVALGDLTAALDYLERSRGRALLDLLAAASIAPLEALREQATARGDRGTLTELDAVEARLAEARFAADRAQHALAASRDATPGEREPLVTALRAANAALLAAEGEAARRIHDVVPMATPIDVATLRAGLGDGEALLAFHIDDDSGLAFLVPRLPGDIEVTRIAVGAATLDRQISRCAFDARSMRASAPPPAIATRRNHELFSALLPQSLWKKLGQYRRVLVLPHGPLHRLPLEALVTRPPQAGQPPTYWLDEGPEVAYAVSGSMIDWTRRRRDEQRRADHDAAPVRVAALGDPAFSGDGAGEEQRLGRQRSGDLSSRYRLDRLPSTRDEVLAVHEAVTGKAYDPDSPDPRAAVFLGPAATEAALGAVAERARILHLATHHIPAARALALTLPAAPSPGNDGFLQLRDLLYGYRGRLPACEMVVLSACATNVGTHTRDEGMYALPWGFLYAGAPAVVASLWNVNDKSTAALMAAFYRNLQRGEGDRLSALVTAKKQLKSEYPDPRHWAAFVWIGDPR